MRKQLRKIVTLLCQNCYGSGWLQLGDGVVRKCNGCHGSGKIEQEFVEDVDDSSEEQKKVKSDNWEMK